MFNFLNVGTVPTFNFLNIVTVPTWCILNVGTVPTFKGPLIVFHHSCTLRFNPKSLDFK